MEQATESGGERGGQAGQEDPRLVEARSKLGCKTVQRTPRPVEASSRPGLNPIDRHPGLKVVSPAECRLGHAFRSVVRLLMGDVMNPATYSGNLRIQARAATAAAEILPTILHALPGCRGLVLQRSTQPQSLWEGNYGSWAVPLSTRRLLLWIAPGQGDEGHLELLITRKTWADWLISLCMGILPLLMPFITGLAWSHATEDVMPLLELFMLTPVGLLLSLAMRCGHRCRKRARSSRWNKRFRRAFTRCRRALGCVQWFRRVVELGLLVYIFVTTSSGTDASLHILTGSAIAMTLLDLAIMLHKRLQAAYPHRVKPHECVFTTIGRLLLVFHFISYFSIFLVPDIIHSSNTGFLVTLTIVGHIVEGLVSNYKLEFEDDEVFETEIMDTNCAGATVTLKDLGYLEEELRSRHEMGKYGPHCDAEGVFLTEVFRRRKLLEDSELRREIAALPHILLILRRLDQLKGPSGAASQSGAPSGTSRAIPLHEIKEKQVQAQELTLKERETGRSPKSAERDPLFETTATLLKRHIQLQMRGRRDLRPSTDPEVMDTDRALLVANDLDLEDVPTYLGTPSFVENKAKIQVVVRHRRHVMDSETICVIQRALTCILQDIFGHGGGCDRRSPKFEIESLMEVVQSTPFDEDGQQPPLAPAGLQQVPAAPAAPAPAIAAAPAVPAAPAALAAPAAPAAVPPAQHHVAQNGAAQGQVLNAALQNVPPAVMNNAAAQNPWPPAQGLALPPGGLPMGFQAPMTGVPVSGQALLPAPGMDPTLWTGAQGPAQDPGMPAATWAAAQGPAVGVDTQEDQEQEQTASASSSAAATLELDFQGMLQCTPFHGNALEQQPPPAPAEPEQVPAAPAALPQPPRNLGWAPNLQPRPAAPSAMSFAAQTAWHDIGAATIAHTQGPSRLLQNPCKLPPHPGPGPTPAVDGKATCAAAQSPAVRGQAEQEHENEHEQGQRERAAAASAVAAATSLELTYDPEGVLLSPSLVQPFVDLSMPVPTPDPGRNPDLNVWATEPPNPC